MQKRPSFYLQLPPFLVFLCVFSTLIKAGNPPITSSVVAWDTASQIQIGKSVSTCQEDTEIAPEKRAAIENAALLFVRMALGSDPGAAYRELTEDAQKESDRERFANYLTHAVTPFGPFEPLRVSHSYLTAVTGAAANDRVVCGTPSKPENWVAVSLEPGMENACVLTHGRARNNEWTFVVGLVPFIGKWRVKFFYAGISTFGDLSASDTWLLARKEQGQQHPLNAALLYASALQLAWRGPDLQLGITPAIQEEMERLQTPSEIRGQPPFVWSFRGNTFRILRLGPIAVAGNLYLLIAHEILPWKEDSEVDRKNRELIGNFAAKFPEFSAVFAGVIAEAHESGGGRGFRTVKEVHNGSLDPDMQPAPKQ